MRDKEYRDSFVAAHLSNTVAAQISMLREANGWTQTELAKRAGMKQSRISALEDPNYENIELGTLRRLASAYDVALTVRFVPFSELVEWTTELSPDRLSVSPFGRDELRDSAPLRRNMIVEVDEDRKVTKFGIRTDTGFRALSAVGASYEGRLIAGRIADARVNARPAHGVVNG
jgi:transcriptional regulator with XRE-family HTH domain